MSTENLDALSRIRQARHEISAELGHDPQRFLQHFLEEQQKLRSLVASKREITAPKSGSKL